MVQIHSPRPLITYVSGSGPETWVTQCTGDMGNTQDRTALKKQSLLRGAPPLAGLPD